MDRPCSLRWLQAPLGASDVVRHTPEHTVLYAVGDLHGRLDLLQALLAGIQAHALSQEGTHVQVIFLGDYLSRGIDSRAVVDLVRGWCPEALRARLGVVTLKGNHEDLALRFLAGDLQAARHWFDYDGLDALRDYGVPLPPATPEPLDDACLQQLRQAFADALPASHRAFLDALTVSHRAGDYLFVHAGVRPGIALEAQTERDQMWIRQRFLDSEREHGALVVHGHTISPEPQLRPNRIGIDTGAYESGVLTCLVLQGTQRLLLQAVR